MGEAAFVILISVFAALLPEHQIPIFDPQDQKFGLANRDLMVGRRGIEPLAGPPQSSDGIGFTARHGEDDPLGCMFQIVLRLRIKEL